MERIGKYQIQRVLGRGGMGTVYEAIDPLINRKVALKTMIQGLAETPELRTRFLREAQAAGGLRHRNIVTVYDLGEDRGTPFIAMEFIEGQDLERIIQNKDPHSMEWKLDVLRQICEGLGYAHRAGIVHRDIKPANVRVTPDGEVKIMDFGIAHLQSSTMTKSGLVMGTVHYMAPEQIEGAKIDHRADIFAVGVMAYELVAYRRPFDGETITSVMYKIMHDAPSLEALPKTEYSPGLEAILARAMARKQADRYQSLDDMHADLEDLVRTVAPRVMARDTPPRGTRGSARAGEDEALRRKVQEMVDIRAEVEQARSEGQLQKALSLSRRLAEMSPGDADAARLTAEIESAIQDREVEQLCGTALNYAADGDMELALKIAARIERLAPHSARYRQLKSYLDEEKSRKEAEAWTATAQEYLVQGNLEEAVAAAEEALGVSPSHPVAREIRDRAVSILSQRQQSERVVQEAATAEMERPHLVPPPPKPAPVAAAPAPPPPAPAPPAPAPPPPVVVAPPPPAPPPPAPPPPAPPVVVAAPAPPPPAPAPVPAPAPPPPVVQAAPPPEPPRPAPAPPAPAPAPLTPPPAPAVAAVPAPKPAAPPKPAPAPAPAPAAPPVAAAPAPPPAPAPVAAAPPPAPTPASPAPAATAAPAPAAAAPGPAAPVGSGDPKAEAAALAASAFNHFMANNNAKARKAAEKALALDPANKRAKELMKILGSIS